jgi:hypothetical protein
MFNFLLIISAFGGLSMIIGGMYLLYKGVITLRATPKADALTVRWRKQFVFSTQVPALGFFLMGLALMVLALWYARPKPDLPLTISGSVAGVEAPIKVLVRAEPWDFERGVTGTNPSFTGTVYPNLHTLLVDVTAPGYQPDDRSINEADWLNKHSINLGTINLTKIVVEGQTNPADIAPLPFPTPASSSTGTFGAVR